MDDIFNIRDQLEHPRPPEKVLENVLQHWIDIVKERQSVEDFLSGR